MGEAGQSDSTQVGVCLAQEPVQGSIPGIPDVHQEWSLTGEPRVSKPLAPLGVALQNKTKQTTTWYHFTSSNGAKI